MGFHLGRIWGVPFVLALPDLPGMAVLCGFHFKPTDIFSGNEARHETKM